MKIPDKNPIKGNKKFGVDQPQPSPESKSKGWDRRKQGQVFMQKVMEYQELSGKEIEQLAKKMTDFPQNFKVRELMAFRYATKSQIDDKFLLDWLDRHISKAPIINENKNENNNNNLNTELTKEEKEAIKKIQDETN